MPPLPRRPRSSHSPFTAEESSVVSPGASRFASRPTGELHVGLVLRNLGRRQFSRLAKLECPPRVPGLLLKIDGAEGGLLHRPPRTDDAVPAQEEQVVRAERDGHGAALPGVVGQVGAVVQGDRAGEELAAGDVRGPQRPAGDGGRDGHGLMRVDDGLYVGPGAEDLSVDVDFVGDRMRALHPMTCVIDDEQIIGCKELQAADGVPARGNDKRFAAEDPRADMAQIVDQPKVREHLPRLEYGGF